MEVVKMQKDFIKNFIPNEMPKLYKQDGLGNNSIVYLKLEAVNGWEWYLTEYDNENTFFGFVHGVANEWGYVSLDELNQIYKDGLLWVCENFKPISLKDAIKGVF